MNARPIRSPEIAEMRAFCAAVDLGSIGRAARFLRLSQPALSKRIRGLETIAGTELLLRSSVGVEPTPAGRKIYEEARKALAQIDVVEDLMAGLDWDNRPIRVAASHTIAEFVLPERLTSFQEDERHLVVELVIANSGVVLDLASRGQADIAIGAIAPGEPAIPGAIPFFEGEVAVAVPRRHRWSKFDEIPVDEFLGTAIIMRDPRANSRKMVEATLESRGLQLPPALIELGSTAAVKSAALQRGAPALIARLAIGPEKEGLLMRRVEGMRFPRHFVIVAPARESFSSQGKAFLDHVLQSAEALREFFKS